MKTLGSKWFHICIFFFFFFVVFNLHLIFLIRAISRELLIYYSSIHWGKAQNDSIGSQAQETFPKVLQLPLSVSSTPDWLSWYHCRFFCFSVSCFSIVRLRKFRRGWLREWSTPNLTNNIASACSLVCILPAVSAWSCALHHLCLNVSVWFSFSLVSKK